jgi:hypothetical protein
MSRFTRKPSSGSHSQYLAKITHLVQCGYIDVLQMLSVLWLHSMTCEAYVLYTLQAYTFTQCTAHTPHRSYYATITRTKSVRRLYPH